MKKKIKRTLLAQVINAYIDNDKLKNFVNDEAHYVRKHENKDIIDLKRFIYATVDNI